MSKWQQAKYKDSKGGGMTSAGVKQYRKENPGSKLQTGVDKQPSSSKEYIRQGSFLTRTFGRFRSSGSKVASPPPLVKTFKTKPSEPTRIALSAKAWNSPVPKTNAQAVALYNKGLRLIKRGKSIKKSK